jgi:hypothetical protein
LLLLALTFAAARLTAHSLDNWYARFTNSSPNIYFQDVAYGNGMFVAVANSGMVAISTDGRNWSTNRPVTKVLNGITYGAGQFVAVGNDSTIITSTDGTNWALRNSSVGATFLDVAYGNARFVGVGTASSPTRRVVFVSEDGIAWSMQNSNYPYAGDLCFGNGLFLQSELSGTNLLTLDGTNWWRQPSGTSNNLYITRSAGGAFVSIDTRNWIFASADGSNWSFRGTNAVLRPESIAYGNGDWVVVSGTMPAHSPDLMNWKISPTGKSSHSVVFGNGTFVAVSFGIIQSDPIILLQAAAANTFYLFGPTNVAYQIQAVDSLGVGNSWSTIISNFTITTSPALWSDPDFLDHPQRFYRALLP